MVQKIEAKQSEIECLNVVGQKIFHQHQLKFVSQLLFYSNSLRSTKTLPNSNRYGWHFTMSSHDFRFLLFDPWVLIELVEVISPWPKIVSSKPTISLSFNPSRLEGWAVSFSSEDGSSSIPRSSSSKRSWKICFSSFRLRLLLPAIPNFFSKSCRSDASRAAPSGSKREADAFDSSFGTSEPLENHFGEILSQKKPLLKVPQKYNKMVVSCDENAQAKTL